MMLLDMILFWLFGIPAVAAAFSADCWNVHMSQEFGKDFNLVADCHDRGSNAMYTANLSLGFCLGINRATSQLEWHRYGNAVNFCNNCTATKKDSGHTYLTCSCAADFQKFVTTTINLDEGITNNQGKLWCSALTRKDIPQPAKISAPVVHDALVARGATEFSYLCEDVRMSQSISDTFTLQANCHNPGNVVMFPASIDLNTCLGLGSDSKLEWRQFGNAGTLCTGCTAGEDKTGKTYLTCTCAANGDTRSASMVTSTILLDTGIEVDDGKLWCDPLFKRRGTIQQSEPTLSTPATTGNFTNVCTAIELRDGSELRAVCLVDEGGGITGGITMELDLNLCIGFDPNNKSLDWELGGNFTEHCKNCALHTRHDSRDEFLVCSCDDTHPDKISMIDLDVGIRADSGVLSCVAGDF